MTRHTKKRYAARGGRALSFRMVLLAGLGVVALSARPAEARLIDLHAGARAGGIVGWGSTANTPDFFDKTKGGAMGIEVGAKLLVFDLSASFLQVLNGDGRVGTLSQLMLSFEFDVPVGRDRFQNGKSRNIIRPALGFGVGVGTPGPVSPPLNNAQVSDKGIVSQLELDYEHFLNPFMGIGVEGDYGYHYFLGGEANPVLKSTDHSSGYHMAALATFTFHLGY
jgi:hypothetical protein